MNHETALAAIWNFAVLGAIGCLYLLRYSFDAIAYRLKTRTPMVRPEKRTEELVNLLMLFGLLLILPVLPIVRKVNRWLT